MTGLPAGRVQIWGKHTNFELGARVPLIFHAAGQTAGIKSNTLVESVDIYPTLAALAGMTTTLIVVIVVIVTNN